MTTQEAQAEPAVLKCRYRLATGCTAEYGSKPGLYAHEKTAPAHADHRVTLRDCPECGARCGDEQKRANHLSGEHGITAGSERRRDLDAMQVKELYDAQQPVPAEKDADLADLYRPIASGYEALNGSAPNGHGPAVFDDLSAARNMFVALVAEVETLRAAVAELEPDAARYRQIKSMVVKD